MIHNRIDMQKQNYAIGVLSFPGSNCDQDMINTLRDLFSARVDLIWHRDSIQVKYDLLIVPGGFSYGDYLRAGAIARFARAMNSLQEHAKRGGAIIGICNGFQILCEVDLLPGALIRNQSLKHICKDVILHAPTRNAFTKELDLSRTYRIPVSHSDGNYRIEADGLKALQDDDQIVFRYAQNPNGSVDDIAGITDKNNRILGMMPHPERAANSMVGNLDGKLLLESFLI